MKEERLKILQMVASGKIVPEEAEKLLTALENRERQKQTAQPEGEKKEKKFLRILITKPGGSTKKINVPLRLLHLGIDLTRFIPQELQQKVGIADLRLSESQTSEEILKALEELNVDIAEPSGETIRIFTD